jgi:hypothetical protein
MNKRTVILALIAPSLLLVACGGDDTSTPPPVDGGNPDNFVAPVDANMNHPDTNPPPPVDAGTDGGRPAPPTLGTQLDRMGRPAINTALNHLFDANAATKGAAKDAYNADNSPANWATYVPQFKSNMAIIDSLDGVCGNQAGYGALGNPDYTTLATVLSADFLWVNTGSTTCTTYLGVELNALGIANTDCGGRTPSENTIDETYSLLAVGAASGVSNGITAPASPPTATFPYFAAPH